MPRYRRVSITDSETDYSESDVSMMEYPRRQHRRRSISRTRYTPSYSNTYLNPNTLHEDVRIHRSASTGARRDRRERDRDRERERQTDRERDRVQPTAVIVDIKNDSRNTSSNKNRKQHREQSSREENTYLDPYESEDETVLRRHSRRRPRASTSVSRSRDASPMHHPARDFDLVIDQRMLENNDKRQDFELFRQQQEIERLERKLARQRVGDQEIRLIKEDEDRYEDDMNDKLRRLQKYEEAERLEEEKAKAERRYKLQRLEAEARAAAEKDELKRKMHHEKLVELQRQLDEEAERERVKKEIKDQEAREALELQQQKMKEAQMKAAAVEEWKLAEERRRIAEKEAEERADKEFKERLMAQFGMTLEEVEKFLKKKEKKEKEEKEEKKEKKEEKEEKKDKKEEEEQRKATWIKVHRKHLLPDTLIAYQLPWAWDELDGNYIIIKTWISEGLQDELFAHSRRLREGKLVTQTTSSLTELRVNDRNKDKMYLVRKKSPSRRSWIFT
ncbi:uncharacterized protein BDV17DRAFT_250924 [Aspergillus undulatus]|uniref:uncharacterized protein n=1 Tax=Aspergillus undulatus TaxID=1810928 RepID=UPI003CCDECCB